jgi:16S rRNA (adenine1518-N6/adenine1519-N6)-dimethyltransferase
MLILSEMRRLLDEHEIRLTKSLGQNFLHDANQLHRIVQAAQLTAADHVLEIGPGLGPLTEALLAQGVKVLAIEKDRRLVEVLRDRLAGSVSGLELVHADALAYLRVPGRDWRGWKLVANLPYAVASPILVELAMSACGPDRMVVTVQREVARRLAATAGQHDYGLLTLLVQVHYEASSFFKVPATCFFPVPDVDSACITLRRRHAPLVSASSLPAYERIVKRAFSQRRKMMLKLLRADWPARPLESSFAALGLAPSIRAEAVTVEQFAALTERLHAFMDPRS